MANNRTSIKGGWHVINTSSSVGSPEAAQDELAQANGYRKYKLFEGLGEIFHFSKQALKKTSKNQIQNPSLQLNVTHKRFN